MSSIEHFFKSAGRGGPALLLHSVPCAFTTRDMAGIDSKYAMAFDLNTLSSHAQPIYCAFGLPLSFLRARFVPADSIKSSPRRQRPPPRRPRRRRAPTAPPPTPRRTISTITGTRHRPVTIRAPKPRRPQQPRPRRLRRRPLPVNRHHRRRRRRPLHRRLPVLVPRALRHCCPPHRPSLRIPPTPCISTRRIRRIHPSNTSNTSSFSTKRMRRRTRSRHTERPTCSLNRRPPPPTLVCAWRFSSLEFMPPFNVLDSNVF